MIAIRNDRRLCKIEVYVAWDVLDPQIQIVYYTNNGRIREGYLTQRQMRGLMKRMYGVDNASYDDMGEWIDQDPEWWPAELVTVLKFTRINNEQVSN